MARLHLKRKKVLLLTISYWVVAALLSVISTVLLIINVAKIFAFMLFLISAIMILAALGLMILKELNKKERTL